MRYCFERDDDCHNYLIPLELQKDFNDALNKINSVKSNSDEWYDLIDDFESQFEDMRIDSISDYSFTEPERC